MIDERSRIYRHRPFAGRDLRITSVDLKALTEQQWTALHKAQAKIAAVISKQRQMEAGNKRTDQLAA